MTRSLAEVAARLEAVRLELEAAKQAIIALTAEEASLLAEIAPFLEPSPRLPSRARSSEIASCVMANGPISITEVTSRFGIAYNAAAMALSRLVRDGKIVRVEAGLYVGAGVEAKP